jgi:hypothetical protein
LDIQDIEAAESCAEIILNKVMTRLGYENEQDIPEAIAIRLIDGLEWCAPSPDIARLAAHKLVEDYELPRGVSGHLKKHFDLTY